MIQPKHLVVIASEDLRQPSGPVKRLEFLPWALVYVVGAIVGMVRGQACTWTATGCVEPYWLEFWLLDYSQGFQRRALLGTVARLFTRTMLDVVVVNAIAFGVCSVIVFVLIRRLFKASATFWGHAALAVVMISPLVSVLFEVLGDPLQVVFGLFLILLAVMARAESGPVRAVCCGGFALVCLLIHEASLFLFLPAAVALALRSVPGRKTYLMSLLVAAPLLVGIVAFGGIAPPDPAYRAFNSISGTIIPREPEPLTPFGALLEEEARRNFGSVSAWLFFAAKFPRIWFVPCLGLVLIAGTIWRDRRAAELKQYWIFLSACSMPLYAIAHDWGRFSATTFWVAVALTAFTRVGGQIPVPPAPQTLKWPEPGVVLAVAGFLILAAQGVGQYYREEGTSLEVLFLLPVAAIAWLRWWQWSRRSPAAVT